MPTGLDELPKIAAPAMRALHSAGYTTLRQLANTPRRQLAELHGMGPKALTIVEQALAEHGLQTVKLPSGWKYSTSCRSTLRKPTAR